jgi:hypothetical protein
VRGRLWWCWSEGEERGSAGVCVPLMHFTAVVFAILPFRADMLGSLNRYSWGDLGLEGGSLV